MCGKKNCNKKLEMKNKTPKPKSPRPKSKSISKQKKKDLSNKLKFYEAIHKVPNSHRCNLIQYLSNDGTDLLCEAIHNAVNVNLGLKGTKKKKLVAELKKCGEKKIQTLCKKSTPVEIRRKILTQKGGFLGTLLSVLFPTIISLIGSLTSSK